MKLSEYRRLGREALKGNWGYGIILMLLGVIISVIITSITGLFSFAISLIIVPSTYIAFLKLIDGKKISNYFSALFSSCVSKKFGPITLNYLLSQIFTFFWSLLFVIPAFIKIYSYFQAIYIANDLVEAGETVSPTQAISESRKLMNGHKWELFLLHLSFIGWGFLCVLTFGIGFLWLVPYIHATNASYYRQLAGDKYRKPTVTMETNVDTSMVLESNTTSKTED